MRSPSSSTTLNPVPVSNCRSAARDSSVPCTAGVRTCCRYSPGATICTPACRANSGNATTALLSGSENVRPCGEAANAWPAAIIATAVPMALLKRLVAACITVLRGRACAAV
ncbi:hypothetical protein NDY24_10260 [Xanthomonas hortorum pv. pelargonii]|nr:hypothetical protein NDY24_10260 [Xanthomonas hortorum pv. pelargonii]